MKKFFLNIYARFTLPCFLFINKIDDNLDKLFWVFSHSELTDVREDDYHLYFNVKGMKVKVWNSNKWFAWLSSGHIYRENNITYRWVSIRPSAYTMLLFRNHLKSYYDKNIVDEIIMGTKDDK